ncbi:GtrA family protein [Photobacterium makurazakiensis]|uniref:GtrA family protein n=1 Tax=Photobacterium makurazakiensis TaxID=2910234 RepID=UPI003D0FAAC9
MKFAVIGGCGFLIDATAVFYLSTVMTFEAARGIAFWVAASSNWWLNRIFTFKHASPCQPFEQWSRFLFSSVIGFAPNYGIYYLLISTINPKWISAYLSIGPQWEVLWPYVAMVPGVLCGMLVNFTLSERWVFQLDAVKS